MESANDQGAPSWTAVRLNKKGKELADKFGYEAVFYRGHYYLVLTREDRVLLRGCDTAARIINSHYFIQLNYDSKTALYLATLCEEAGAGEKVTSDGSPT
jgi:hypothetical protein